MVTSRFLHLFLPFLVWLGIFPPLAGVDIHLIATMNNETLIEQHPLEGTLEVTTPSDKAIPLTSFSMDGKPLSVTLVRQETFGDKDPFTVSIYRFTLPPQAHGNYLLPAIKMTLNQNAYYSTPSNYRVIEAAVKMQAAKAQAAGLDLEAFVEGPTSLYPGQRTTLIYRYTYQGSLGLKKEILPFLDPPSGLLKIGYPEIKDTTTGQASVRLIRQNVQALTVGDYVLGPSQVEAETTEGSPSQKFQVEAPAITLNILPFPQQNKPLSFTGAIGHLNLTTQTAAKQATPGQILPLEIVLSGQTDDWDSVVAPALCCQPGFSGFFSQDDVPPRITTQANKKTIQVDLKLLSSTIKAIPSVEFTYFDTTSKKYVTLQSAPLPLTVTAPPLNLPVAPKYPALAPLKTPAKPLPQLIFPTPTLKTRLFATWQVTWLIPWALILLGGQIWLRRLNFSQLRLLPKSRLPQNFSYATLRGTLCAIDDRQLYQTKALPLIARLEENFFAQVETTKESDQKKLGAEIREVSRQDYLLRLKKSWQQSEKLAFFGTTSGFLAIFALSLWFLVTASGYYHGQETTASHFLTHESLNQPPQDVLKSYWSKEGQISLDPAWDLTLGQFFYDLGNYPLSILYGERALKISPRFKEAGQLVQQARAKLDLPPPVFANFTIPLSLPSRLQTFALLTLLLFGIASSRLWFPKISLRLLFSSLVFLWILVALNLFYMRYLSPLEAVVTTTTFVYRGPSPQYAKALDTPILAGREVVLLGQENTPADSWEKIALADGTLGYVPTTTIAPI